MRLARATWRHGIELAGSRRGALLLFVCALVAHAIESIGWQVRLGRDSLSYLRAYSEIFHWHATLPWLMLQRPPVAPLLVGGSLDHLGGGGTEVAIALLYACSIVAWAYAAAAFGRGVALVTAVVLILYPGYGELFHEVSGDVVFAAAFALWAPVLVRAMVKPSMAKFAGVGLGVAVLTLVRPGNQVLVAVALAPLLLPASFSRRLQLVAVVAATAVVPLVGWAFLNGARYDDRVVARGGQSTVPMFRAFVTDRIVSPDNGPASRRLADLVEQKLLPLEPYRSRHVDVETFFSSGDPRMHEDMVSLSDRVLGWDSDYTLLGQVAREAVRAHPRAYLEGVGHDLWRSVTQPLYGPTTATEPVVADGTGRRPAQDSLTTARRIPAANQGAYLGTPDQRIREVWTSPTVHYPVFEQPKDAVRFAAIEATVGRLQAVVPTHRRFPGFARWLDRASHVFPPPLLWLVLGVAGIVRRRPENWRAAALPALSGLLVLGVTSLGLPYVGEYGLPVAPALVLLGVVGVLGPRAASTSRPDPA
jgi:hypothetical protein